MNPTEHRIGIGNVSSLESWNVRAGLRRLRTSPAVANGFVYTGPTTRCSMRSTRRSPACDGTLAIPKWIAQGLASPVLSSPGGRERPRLRRRGRPDTLRRSGEPAFCDFGGSVPAWCPVWTGTTGGDVDRRRRWPTASCTSAPTTASSTRSTRKGDQTAPARPKVCTPLWTADRRRGPLVARGRNGVVYVGSDDDKLYAFNATGTTSCSGTRRCARRCGPRQRATTCIVTRGRRRRRLRRLRRRQALRVRRRGHDGLLRQPEDLRAAVDRDHRRTSVVARSRQRRRLRRLGRPQALRVRRRGYDELLGTPKVCTPLWTATTGGNGPVVARGRERRRLRRLRRPEPLRVRRKSARSTAAAHRRRPRRC